VIVHWERAEAVYILGDLLHFKYGLECRLLLEWKELIEYYAERGIKFTALAGNHDLPWSNERSAISLLPGRILTSPLVEIIEGTMYAYLPWFPPEDFKHHSQQLAYQAMAHPGLKFLFSHVSLAEGFVSPSNYQVETQIRMGDLYPDTWDHVWVN